MSQTLDPSRTDRLKACEQRIFAGFRRGIEATCSIADELLIIKSERLYEERGYNTFKEYVQNALRLEMRYAERFLNINDTMKALEDRSIKPLNESQAAELARLPVELRAHAWDQVLQTCDSNKAEITVNAVKRTIDKIAQQTKQKDVVVTNGELTIEIPPDEEEEVETAETEEEEAAEPATAKRARFAQPERPSFSEDGELALDRIRSLCGSAIADALEQGKVQHLNEASIIKWAEEDDAAVKHLKHYLIDLGWKLAKALEYDSQAITDDTKVYNLKILARARGKVAFNDGEFKITVEHILRR